MPVGERGFWAALDDSLDYARRCAERDARDPEPPEPPGVPDPPRDPRTCRVCRQTDEERGMFRPQSLAGGLCDECRTAQITTRGA